MCAYDEWACSMEKHASKREVLNPDLGR